MSAITSKCPKLPWMIDFFSSHNGTVPNAQLKAVYAQNQLEYQRNLNIESVPAKKRLTSIMCTIGPKSNSIEVLESLIESGMNVARFKIPMISMTECEEAIANLQAASDNYSKKIGSMHHVAIAFDLRGPEIRTGILKDPDVEEIELNAGDETAITGDSAFEEHVTEDMIYVDYQNITEVVEPGDKFYLDNNIALSALEIVGSVVRCLVLNAGKIGDHASVSLESSILDLPSVSLIELNFAKTVNVDFILVSNVKNKMIIEEVKQLLDRCEHIQVIAKIESGQGVKKIDEIVEAADGILISRADLAADISQEKLFLAQKSIIAACNKAGKPVICAPQVLESMTTNMIPRRSEVMDVTAAILDGVDCLMLSRETATGDFPNLTLKTLENICKEAEVAVYQRELFRNLSSEPIIPFEPIYALAIGIVETSLKCSAAAIILLTTSGRTARVLAKYRPRCPIIALTRHARVARQLTLFRGIEPIHFVKKPLIDWNLDVRKRIQFGITFGKYHGYIRAGDTIITVKGSRPGTGFTNCMEVYYASDFDTIQAES